MKSDLRIAAYLGVKDEVELIERSIDHLRAIGVDYIMACDMSSTDGTAELLEKYCAPDFSILTLTNKALGKRADKDDTWFSHSERRYKNAPADWVIFLDADEFWLPASGNLKDCEALYSADVLSVERFNVVLGPDGPLIPMDLAPNNYDRALLFAEAIPDFRLEKQKNEDLPWIMGAVGPKIAARPSKIDGTITGQHDAIANSEVLLRTIPNDLVIAHVALSTRKRFERKVSNIRAICDDEGIDLSLPEEGWRNHPLAWHWRRWATLAEPDVEFAHNITSSDCIARLRSEGVIRSAQEMLAERAAAHGPVDAPAFL